MADLIDRQALKDSIGLIQLFFVAHGDNKSLCDIINEAPAVDAVEVCRCQNCIHSEPLERNCEINGTAYMHCKIGRGEEEKNVWHKYKKYYRDYSLVDRFGYCDEGERRGDNGYENWIYPKK